MKYTISTLLMVVIALLFQSCDKDSPDLPIPVDVKQMTLIYAVNGNNLSADLYDNERQMLQAMQKAKPGEYMLLLYKSIDSDTAGLYRLISGPGATDFELVKSYSRDVWSTDPDRISEVIRDAVALGDTDVNNLFFWGHGMAWSPLSNEGLSKSGPDKKAFGGDNNSKEWVEIDELAKAVPDGVFDLIWFDCCYMANIETLYQLRHKSDLMVAYPTEIWQDGLPYNTVLPYLMTETPDIKGAVGQLYEYYNKDNRSVTVSIFDLTQLNELARICSEIYADSPERPNPSGLLNYSRSRGYEYYDFGQFVEETARINGLENKVPEFRLALDRFVVHTLASPYDFNRQPIDPEQYSGISTHFYKNDDSAQERYYRTLDWYRDVYPQGE